MGDDTFNRYGAMAGGAGSVTRSSFSAYSEAPPLASYSTMTPVDQWSIHTDYLLKNINSSQPRSYGYADLGGIRNYPEPVNGDGTSGLSTIVHTSLEDSLVKARREIALGNSPGLLGIADTGHRANSLRNAEGPPISAGESSILFVDGLSIDCTRREVGHIFRPFVGYKDIRVVHKEPRRIGDKAMVLCFVEFIEPRYARAAMEALQGYQFDDKKPDSPALKIHFAHFPFRLPSYHDER